MDNTLLSGIVSSLATIVGAIIGAAATIGAAFWSKNYADKQLSQSKMSDEIKPSVRTIIQFLGLLRVTGASVFTARKDKAFIDGETGISIVILRCYPDCIDFEYHLPGQIKSQRVKEARIGWKLLVNYANSLYALTLVNIGYFSDSARFDFRKINNVIVEAYTTEQWKKKNIDIH